MYSIYAYIGLNSDTAELVYDPTRRDTSLQQVLLSTELTVPGRRLLLSLRLTPYITAYTK